MTFAQVTPIKLFIWLIWICLYLITPIQSSQAADSRAFTLAVIPDTQNYIDFRHQKVQGFEFDASRLFIQQMEFVASRSVTRGGDIVFVASVGDVWQHQTKTIDAAHQQRGIGIEPEPILARRAKRTREVIEVELPKAVEGYRIIAETGLPFGVAPGNHDYDAAWSVAGFPPARDKEWSELTQTVADMGMLHVGGLENFRRVFGEDSEFFRGKSWYLAAFRGGANSAQRFSAGGYDFLHIALEMQPGDDVLMWTESVLARYPGLPTIITTHDYLSSSGLRESHPLVDLASIDPGFNNSAEKVWQKLIRRHDQIFLVLCGHQRGQALRVDDNDAGNPVYQILADYQGRGQSVYDFGRIKPRGIGDGWLRLMHFDFAVEPATITVKTYSTYYARHSSEVAEYADWYRENEQPGMTDPEFFAADDYIIRLDGFRQRFLPGS